MNMRDISEKRYTRSSKERKQSKVQPTMESIEHYYPAIA
jgi:hypothetical protein